MAGDLESEEGGAYLLQTGREGAVPLQRLLVARREAKEVVEVSLGNQSEQEETEVDQGVFEGGLFLGWFTQAVMTNRNFKEKFNI